MFDPKTSLQGAMHRAPAFRKHGSFSASDHKPTYRIKAGWVFLAILWGWLGLVPLAWSQNPLDKMLGRFSTQESSDLSDFQETFQLKQRQEELEKLIKEAQRTEVLLRERLEKEIQRYREQTNRYREIPTQKRWHQESEILQLRNKIVEGGEKNETLLTKLQSLQISREQSMTSLKEWLEQYSKFREDSKKWLKERYPPKENTHPTLQRTLKHLRHRLKEEQARLKKIQDQIKENDLYADSSEKLYEKAKLKTEEDAKKALEYEKQQAALLAQAEKQAAEQQALEAKKKAAEEAAPPAETRRRRPSNAERLQAARDALEQSRLKKLAAEQQEKSRLDQEKQRALFQLQSVLNRTLLENHHNNLLYLQSRRQEQGFNEEASQIQLRFFRYLIAQMEDLIQSIVAQAKGGLFYRVPLSMDAATFQAIWLRTQRLRELEANPLWKRWKHISAQLQEISARQTLVQQISFGLYVLFFFLLSMLLRRVLGSLHRSLLRSAAQETTPLPPAQDGTSESAPPLPPARDGASEPQEEIETFSWKQNLAWLLHGLRRIAFSGVLCVASVLAIWLLGQPEGLGILWVYITIAWLGLRAVWVAADLFFAASLEQRVFSSLQDRDAKVFRRTIKGLVLFTFLYYPFLQMVYLLGYPATLTHLLECVYAAGILLGVLYLFLKKDPILGLIPSAHAAGKRVVLWIGRLYPLFYVLALTVLLIYALGYQSLARFVALRLLLSLVILMAAYGIQRVIASLVLWGFERFKRVWPRLENLIKGTPRLIGLLIGLLTFLITASLLLETWGVAGGYKAVLLLLQAPFFQFQNTHISVLSIIQLLACVLGSLWFSGWLRQQLHAHLYPMLRVSAANQHATDTILHYSLSILGLLMGLQWMGVGVGVLAIFAGVIGIGVGFGTQEIANNFISGLIITFGKSVKVGDIIEVEDIIGTVQNISARCTTLETSDGRMLLLPNSTLLTSKIINWSLGTARILISLPVDITRGASIQSQQDLLIEIAKQHPEVLPDPAPTVYLEGSGRSKSLTLQVAIDNPLRRFHILSDLRLAHNEHISRPPTTAP